LLKVHQNGLSDISEAHNLRLFRAGKTYPNMTVPAPHTITPETYMNFAPIRVICNVKSRAST